MIFSYNTNEWIYLGEEKAVDAIIKNGANVELANIFGDKAIHKAALFGNMNVAIVTGQS